MLYEIIIIKEHNIVKNSALLYKYFIEWLHLKTFYARVSTFACMRTGIYGNAINETFPFQYRRQSILYHILSIVNAHVIKLQ